MTKITGNFHLKIAMLTIAILSIAFSTGCNPPPPTSTNPLTISLSVQNPQWAMGQGSSANWQLNNDANHKVKVKVQGLDSNQNATLFRSYTFIYNYTGQSPTWHNETIEVPQSGMFVVQVDIEFTECTWQSASCSFPYTASNKDYFNQRTFTSRPASISIPFSSSQIIAQYCNC